MSKKVVLSSTAKEKLSDLLEYLEDNWSARVKNDFIKKKSSHAEKFGANIIKLFRQAFSLLEKV